MHNARQLHRLARQCLPLAAASRPRRSGVEIYPGFAAAELLEEDGRIVGIATGDMGIGKDGKPTDNFQRGMELRARYTLFAEGCRGSLSKQLMPQLRPARRPRSADLRDRHQGTVGDPRRQPQARPGRAHHRLAARRRHLWRLVPLSFRRQPDLLRLRHRPGLPQSVAVAVRRDAALQDPPRGAQALRGRPAHQLRRARAERGRPAIDPAPDISRRRADRRRGGLRQRAEDQGHAHLDEVRHAGGRSGGGGARQPAAPPISRRYEARLRESWVWQELSLVSNVRPSFAKFGLWGGLAYSALDTYVLRGKAPWTFHHPHPRQRNVAGGRRRRRASTIPGPDGVLTFDRLSSVFISNTNHEENQPPHLHLPIRRRRSTVNWERYRSPEARYCPAGVYEIVGAEEGEPAAADQRAELRALQDLRHQGPDAEHRLGDAGRRRRPQLSRRHVTPPRASARRSNVAPSSHVQIRMTSHEQHEVACADAAYSAALAARSFSRSPCCRPALRPIPSRRRAPRPVPARRAHPACSATS